MLVFFSRLGATYNLSFTGQEILRDKIIGLDGLRRKVLVVEQQDKKYNSQIIDLYEVETCKMKKIYTAINSDGFKIDRIDDYLNCIALEFDFKTGKDSVAVLFYKDESHSVYEIAELETKTKHWEAMLSKMLPNKQQKNI